MQLEFYLPLTKSYGNFSEHDSILERETSSASILRLIRCQNNNHESNSYKSWTCSMYS